MKIYTRFVMDMTTGETLEEESYEYEGEVAWCGGSSGGGGSDGAPKSYYRKMAKIAGKQSNIGEEMWRLYKYGQVEDPRPQREYLVEGKWRKADEARELAAEQASDDDYVLGLGHVDPRDVDLTRFPSRTVDLNLNRVSPLDLEQQKLEANVELLPEMTELRKETLGLQQEQTGIKRGLLPYVQESQQASLEAGTAQMEDVQTGIQQRAPVREAYFNEAMQGVDVEQWADRAGSEVERQFENTADQMNRRAQRLGLDPSDSNFASGFQEGGLDLARAKSGAREEARRSAKKENFRRLGQASSYNLGG